MDSKKTEWKINGECVEACTSPPVCPYYWGSNVQMQLHDGKNQCEGVFTFNIERGIYKKIKLDGLKAGFGFNTSENPNITKQPWKAILYIDEKADKEQRNAIENIFTSCWSLAGDLIKIKYINIDYIKEKIGINGYKYKIKYNKYYEMESEPLLTKLGKARYISGLDNGIIYIGKTKINIFYDNDLPRGKWNKPEMSNTYFKFDINQNKLEWVP